MSSSPVVGVSFPEADTRLEWVDRLGSALDVPVVDAGVVDAAEVEVLVVGNPPGEDLARFQALRFVQSTWAGVDRLLTGAPPVPIARLVAPELSGLMAEFVLTAALLLHRRLPVYHRAQARREWRPRPTRPVGDTRVGVLGYGEMGRPAARALHEAGFEVSAWARSSRSEPIPVVSEREGFEGLLAHSDVVVNLLPLTAETRGILDREAFATMPQGSALVNAARGAHVVESDLLEALDRGHLGDAILDVFSEEPLPPEHPFWSHERVTVLPHVAAPSDPSDLVPHVATNIETFLEGGTPRFLVTPEREVR